MITNKVTPKNQSLYSYKVNIAECPVEEIMSPKQIDGAIENFLNGLDDVPEHRHMNEDLIFETQLFVTHSEIKDFFEVLIPSKMILSIIVFKTEKDRIAYREKIDGPSMRNQVALFKNKGSINSKNNSNEN